MRIEPHINRKLARAGRLASCIAFLAVVGGFWGVFHFAFAADRAAHNVAKGFSSPLDYFPPPNQYQMRSYLESAESELGPNGTVILREAKLQTFHTNGTKEMIVTAPHCVYDYSARVVTSPGALNVQMWEQNNKRPIQLQGTNGFYWQQTNAFLIISNQQLTTIGGPLTNSLIP